MLGCSTVGLHSCQVCRAGLHTLRLAAVDVHSVCGIGLHSISTVSVVYSARTFQGSSTQCQDGRAGLHGAGRTGVRIGRAGPYSTLATEAGRRSACDGPRLPVPHGMTGMPLIASSLEWFHGCTV